MAEVTERDREAANRLFFLCGSLGNFDAACAFIAAYREAAVAEERAARQQAEQELARFKIAIQTYREALAEQGMNVLKVKLLEAEAARVKAEQERDDFKRIGRQFEEDARKHFEQSCKNLSRAEAAEARLRAVIEAANRLSDYLDDCNNNHAEGCGCEYHEATAHYRKVRDDGK